MKKTLFGLLNVFLFFLAIVTIFNCSQKNDFSGTYRLASGSFASDEITIIKINNSIYSVEYIDKLNRGNKLINLAGEKNGDELSVKMREMNVIFKFSKGYNKFSFSTYGINFTFKKVE